MFSHIFSWFNIRIKSKYQSYFFLRLLECVTCGSIKDHFNEQPITRRKLHRFVRECRNSCTLEGVGFDLVGMSVSVRNLFHSTEEKIIINPLNNDANQSYLSSIHLYSTKSSTDSYWSETSICLFSFFTIRWKVTFAVQLVLFQNHHHHQHRHRRLSLDKSINSLTSN